MIGGDKIPTKILIIDGPMVEPIAMVVLKRSDSQSSWMDNDDDYDMVVVEVDFCVVVVVDYDDDFVAVVVVVDVIDFDGHTTNLDYRLDN